VTSRKRIADAHHRLVAGLTAEMGSVLFANELEQQLARPPLSPRWGESMVWRVERLVVSHGPAL
jgi:hypothetical protein